MLKCRLSFTCANLMPLECKVIALQYIANPDWEVVQKQVLSENLLGKARSTSAFRQTRELITRLKNIDPVLIKAIPVVRPLIASRICFLSVLKTYKFVKDFINEVVCYKWVEHKDIVRSSDFIDCYSSKTITHPELSNIADSTRKKIRQVLFYMLVQAEYIETSKNGVIIPVHFDTVLVDLVRNESNIIKRCLGVFE